MSAPEEFQGRYVTEAVESGVRDRAGETIGHVGLLDVDGVDLEGAEDVAGRLPGVTVVLKSSERSYHVWSLAVRPLSEWVEAATKAEGVDGDHIALSESRECSVLRVDSKVDMGTGEVVKPAPTPVRVETTATDLPQSEPHARLLRREFGADVSITAGQQVGESAERRVYMADIGGRGE